MLPPGPLCIFTEKEVSGLLNPCPSGLLVTSSILPVTQRTQVPWVPFSFYLWLPILDCEYCQSARAGWNALTTGREARTKEEGGGTCETGTLRGLPGTGEEGEGGFQAEKSLLLHCTHSSIPYGAGLATRF